MWLQKLKGANELKFVQVLCELISGAIQDKKRA